MTSMLRGVNDRVLRLLDGLVVLWVTIWLLVGVATGVEIWRLSRIADSAEISAQAVDRAGEALELIGGLPLVGETPGALGADVRAAAAEIEASAVQTRADMRRLSILLGLSIFAIPVTPVAGLYVPLRLRRRTEVASIRRSLRTPNEKGALEGYLARRAVQHLSFVELQSVSPDPVGDLASGRYDRLAAAELRRLGIEPPQRPDAATADGR